MKCYDSQVKWAEAAVEIAEKDKVSEKEIKRLKKLVKKAKRQHDDSIMEVGNFMMRFEFLRNLVYMHSC